MATNSTIKARIFSKKVLYKYELIWHLVRRDFSLQYKRSVLGVLWSLLLPLVQLLVLIFIFEKVIPLNIEAYPVFLFSALLPWSWFSNCLTSAGGLFINNRDLVRRPNFEPSMLVIINTLSNLLLLIVALPLLFLAIPFFERGLSINLIFLPLLILIQGLLSYGLGLIIATINVFYRDIQHIVSVALLMLFFLTPVFYGIRSIGKDYRFLYDLNPMAGLIESYRLIIYYDGAPDWSSILVTGVISLITCLLGYIIYKSQIHHVVDII